MIKPVRLMLFTAAVAVLFGSCASMPSADGGAGTAPTTPAVSANLPGEDEDLWFRDAESGDLTWLPGPVVFPASREYFEIGETTVYDDVGLDVSVGYTSPDIAMWATTYFYLMDYFPEPDLYTHFEATVGAVLDEWENSEIRGAWEEVFTYGDVQVDGYSALIRYGRGPTKGDWGGYVLLYPWGEYYFMTRISFLGADDQDSVDAAWTVLLDLVESFEIPEP
jgi:hypothetical protein